MRFLVRSTLHVTTALAAMTLALACGGCGPEPAEEPAATEAESAAADVSDVDVCALLTSAEIEEALGEAPGDSTSGTEGLGECSWAGSGESSEPAVHLVLDEAEYDSYEDFIASYLRDFGEEPSRERHREVSGVGDWAMYEEDDRALLLHVGDRVLRIQVAAPAGEEEAVALARSAAPRMP